MENVLKKKKPDGRQTDTRDRILDAAEKLFAERGFDSVTIRHITQQANANLAMVTYYFGSKEKLLESAFERRASVLNRERRDALNRALDQTEPTITDVVTAFVEPYLRRGVGADAGWRNYCRLIGIISSTGRWDKMLAQMFDDNARLFVNTLHELAPSLDRPTAAQAFLFCVSTMLYSLNRHNRLCRLVGETPFDPEQFIKEEIEYISGGIRAMARLAG